MYRASPPCIAVAVAIESGVSFFDTSDVHGAAGSAPTSNGFGHNETLLGEAVRGRREEVVLATKFSARPSPEGGVVFDGRPEYVRAACDASLQRLQTDHIDLYYYHRLDPTVPVEETVGAMAELIVARKVRAIGLSNVGVDILRQGSRRATSPKFSDDNLRHNPRLVEELKRFSEARGATPEQVALAWLLAQPTTSPPFPAPSGRSAENARTTAVALSADEVAVLGEVFSPDRVRGGQYGELGVRSR